MSSKTTNYNLHKIELNDAPPDITTINGNWDIIDEELAKKYDADNKPSPNDLGAVSKAGDTMTGNSLGLLNGQGKITVGTDFIQLESYKTVGDTNNRRLLALKDSNDLHSSLQIVDWTDGSSDYYKIYGEHNITKGTTDIGANSTLATGTIHLVYE